MKSELITINFSFIKKLKTYILLGICILFNQHLMAQPGKLDQSFGLNGMVINEPGVKNSAYTCLALQNDSKIVTAGFSTIGQLLDFSLTRYDTTGNLDQSFGINGKVTTMVNSWSCSIHTLNIQSDGKMIVAGYADNGNYLDFVSARYNIDGSLDTTFGTGGFVITSFGIGSEVTSSAIQSDGKIVVAGYMGFSSGLQSGGTKFALARYNLNGSLDSTFGIHGKITTAVRDMGDGASTMGIQYDGKIVLGGWSYKQNGLGITTDIALVRYNYNGIIDSTFGIDGKVITEIGISSGLSKLLILDDNKILTCGNTYNGANQDFALVRYNNDGNPDTSFGINGIAITSIGIGDDRAQSLVLQPDKKFIVIGSTSDVNNGFQSNFALARYNANGSLDNTFGINGITVTIDSTISAFTAGMLQTDGKLLTAGMTRVYNTGYSVLARYISGLPNDIRNIQESNISLKIFPNPAKQKTTIEYKLNTAGNLSIYLYNSLGQCKKTYLLNELQQPGKHSLEITIPSEITNGIYWIVLSSTDGTISKSLIINNSDSFAE
jgi:uncharacterized delta-60 repeat protein